MKAQIVSFRCVLKNRLGQVLGSSFNHDVINQLESTDGRAGSQQLRGLVAGLQNVHAGEKRLFTVPAAEAYGHYDPDLLVTVSRSELPGGARIQLGHQIAGYAHASGEKRDFRVVGVRGDQVMLDANHPLAGQDLIFDVEVTEARDADEEDLQESFVAAPQTYLH